MPFCCIKIFLIIFQSYYYSTSLNTKICITLTFFCINKTFYAHFLDQMAFFIDYFLKHFSIVFAIFKSGPKSYVFKLAHIGGD